MAALDETDHGLGERLNIQRNHISAFRSGEWKRASYVELRRLAVWAASRGFQLPTLRPSPVWRRFQNSSVRIFRAGNRWDTIAENTIQNFLHDLDSEAKLFEGEITQSAVASAMHSGNCVFIGSPKTSRATEIALSLLFGIVPSRRKIAVTAPIRFTWVDVTDERPFTRLPSKDQTAGLEVLGSDGWNSFDADFLGTPNFRAYEGTGRDVGLVAVVSGPLESKREVTTLFVAGYSGFSTAELAVEIPRDGLPLIQYELNRQSRELVDQPMIPGVVSIGVLETVWKKPSGGDSRTVIAAESKWHAPSVPLESLFGPSKIVVPDGHRRSKRSSLSLSTVPIK